jgi:hypothetical protein
MIVQMLLDSIQFLVERRNEDRAKFCELVCALHDERIVHPQQIIFTLQAFLEIFDVRNLSDLCNLL